jgi:hypothetical protein
MGKRISQLKLCFEAVYVYFEVSSMSLQRFFKQIKCKKITLRFLMMAIPTTLEGSVFLTEKSYS